MLIAVPAGAQTAQVQTYFGIQPGVATKANVDLLRGEPTRRVSEREPVYEYAPAREDNDSRRLVISFDPDTLQVARIDVHLKSATLAEPLRQRFGTKIVSRDRADGGREELFYPQLQGLIFSSRAADAPVVAVSFLARRTLGHLYVDRFDALMTQRAYEEARTEADKAVAVDPDGGEGYLAQGRYYLSQRNWDEALVRFTAASTAKYSAADRCRARLAVARVYVDHKNFPDKADEEFRGAVSSAPPELRAQAHLAYGKFLESQKKPDEALAEFAKAVDADGADLAAGEAFGQALWAKGEFVRALPVYKELSRHADATPAYAGGALAHFRYAYALGRAGKAAPAIAEYQKIVTHPELGPVALNNLGGLAEDDKNWVAAVDYFQRSVRASPTVLLHNLNLAQALNGAGRFAEAVHQGQVTLKLKPNDALTMFTIAQSWGGLKKKKETLMWLQRAVEAGFKDRAQLTSDARLAFVQDNGDFKKLLLTVN